MQLTLIDSKHPDGRQIDVEFRHEPPEIPGPEQATNAPLIASMPIDVIGGEHKSTFRAHINLASGELHLIGAGETLEVEDSRSADEIRLTLYTRLLKSWSEDPGEEALDAAAKTLYSKLEADVQRISGQDPSEQAPGRSSDSPPQV